MSKQKGWKEAPITAGGDKITKRHKKKLTGIALKASKRKKR
jgi:hypothetical protein